MCLLCIEIAKGKMTFKEIGSALGEFHVDPEHEKELEQVILDNVKLDASDETLAEYLKIASGALAYNPLYWDDNE